MVSFLINSFCVKCLFSKLLFLLHLFFLPKRKKIRDSFIFLQFHLFESSSHQCHYYYTSYIDISANVFNLSLLHCFAQSSTINPVVFQITSRYVLQLIFSFLIKDARKKLRRKPYLIKLVCIMYSRYVHLMNERLYSFPTTLSTNLSGAFLLLVVYLK